MRKHVNILLVMVCIGSTSCVGNRIQETASVVAQGPEVESTGELDLSTPVEPSIATQLPTDTPDSVTSAIKVENELQPGYEPESWTIFPTSELSIGPPSPSFTVFDVDDIAEDEHGVMWFATTYGLVSFDGATWRLVSQDTKMIVNALVETTNDDSVWFTMNDGIHEYKNGGDHLRLYLEGFQAYDVLALEISPDKEVWVIFDSGDIRIYGNDGWREISSDREFPLSQISDLIIDDSRNVYASWIASTFRGGLAHYHEAEWAVYDFDKHLGIPESDELPIGTFQLIIDDQGHVWFYLWRRGLFEYYEGEIYLRAPYVDRDHLGYHPDSMVFDNEGQLWLGEHSRGMSIARYAPGSDELRAIDGSSEFYVYTESSEHPFIRYKTEGILPFEMVSALYVDSQNNLWVATDLGIYVLDLDSLSQ